MADFRTSRSRMRDGASTTFRQQSELIVECARKCIEEKGVRKTTLVDIAREADITRELIYYYFAGKTEILERVLESYVHDAVETARLWCDTWDDPDVNDDTPLSREAIMDAVAAVRRFVFSAVGTRRSMFAVLNEMDVRQEVFSRMCKSIINELGSSHAAKRLNATFSWFDETTTENAFMFCILGIIGIIECNNSSDDEVVDMLCAYAS